MTEPRRRARAVAENPDAGAVLPLRRGPAPWTEGPEQLTQNAPGWLQGELLRLIASLPGVEVAGSFVCLPGTRACHLAPLLAHGTADAFMAGNEFGHLHPGYDGSLHLCLPARLARASENGGWGSVDPAAGAVLVYGPRDRAELHTIWFLVRAAYRYARGTPGTAPGTAPGPGREPTGNRWPHRGW